MTTRDVVEARDAIVHAAARVAGAGLSPGSSGNVSMRVGSTILMSPTNSDLAALDAGTLSVLDLEGHHLDGPRPSKEVPLHLAFYARDARAAAVVHVHSAHAVALSCRTPWAAHTAIPPITPYVLLKVGQVPLIPYFAPGDARQADAVMANEHEFRAALLANHGQIAAGSTLDEAVTAVVEIEEAARTVLLQPDERYNLLAESEIVELTTSSGVPWRAVRSSAGAAG